jgi:DMSO reductase anchor subunit
VGALLRGIKWGFLVTAFVAPVALIALGASLNSIGVSIGLLAAACLVQYAGLVAKRWFFFAEAKHPQNLYYARVG